MGLREALFGAPAPTSNGSVALAAGVREAARLEGGVVASANRINGTAEQKSKYRRLIQPWQESALSWYDLLGECWYPAQFYGRALSRLRIYPALLEDDGELKEIKDGLPTEVLARVKDPGGGGRSNMLRTYGQLRFLTGESYLVVTDPDGENEAWEMVSTDELRVQPGAGYVRYRAPQLNPETYQDAPEEVFEPLPGAAIVYRFWQRHPRYSALADSPVKAVLDLYDLLARLRAAAIARSKSRAADAGIFFLANEIKWPETGVQDDDPNQDPFLRDLTTALVSAIRDPGEASAAVPMIARIPADMIENQRGFYHLKLRDASEAYPEDELIDKTIRHIALGLDIPPEVLTGLSDTNHWNAWMIQDETWQSHLGPVAQGFCDDLTTCYFQPALREAGEKEWARLVVAYDAAEVINHPDRGKDALEAFDRGGIGYARLRESLGFADDDAPDDDELEVMLAFKSGNAQALDGAEEAEQGADDASEVAEDAPVEPEQQEREEDEEVAASVVALAEMAVERCRELAGSRLRTHSRGCDACAAKLDGVDNALVASVLGHEQATELSAPVPSVLVAGGAATFAKVLRRRGVEESWVEALSNMVELHAARTLFQPEAPALPAGFLTAARRSG